MKFILLAFSLIFITLACSRSNSFSFYNLTRKYYARPDTIFLKTNYGAIYSTTDTSFDHYDWLIPKIDIDDTSIYNYQIEDLIKEGYKYSHNESDLPMKWTELFLFNGRYYVYSPSDWMVYEGLILTDTILYHPRGVDSNLEFINSVKKSNDSTYKLELDTQFYIDSSVIKKTILTIERIDQKLKIYKWSWNYENGEILPKTIFCR